MVDRFKFRQKPKSKEERGLFVRRNKYNELLTKGRYCYFFEKGTRIVTVVSYFPPMILPIPVPYKDELIINYNNGKMYLLSKRLMKKILQTDDPELIKAFLNEPQKGKKLHQYILKYNERNVAKIK